MDGNLFAAKGPVKEILKARPTNSPTLRFLAVSEPWRLLSLDPSNLRKAFTKVLTDAKLRIVRFHDLRHGFASLLLQNGESLTYVKEQMGHSSINVTVDIYWPLDRQVAIAPPSISSMTPLFQPEGSKKQQSAA